jgi:hypothetical protein
MPASATRDERALEVHDIERHDAAHLSPALVFHHHVALPRFSFLFICATTRHLPRLTLEYLISSFLFALAFDSLRSGSYSQARNVFCYYVGLLSCAYS